MRAACIVALSVLVPIASIAQAPDLRKTIQSIDATDADLVPILRAAITSADPRVRTAAARVALVRNTVAIDAELRPALSSEQDPVAAREELRALALTQPSPDVDFLLQSAKRFPGGIDASIAYSFARRGSEAAMQMFQRRDQLRILPSWDAFFRSALFGSPAAISAVSARVLGSKDEHAWEAVLDIARESAVAVPATVLSAAMRGSSEGTRAATYWYLAHGYAGDPTRLPELLKPIALEDSGEVSSDSEAFGRELVRRLAGAEPREDARWLEWLATKEADSLLENDQELMLKLSDKEFAVRESHCKDMPLVCVLPTKDPRRIPSRPVVQPDFNLPNLLPFGLADAVVSAFGCRGGWLGVGSATVDSAGRVQKLELKDYYTSGACRAAMNAIARLSLADNTRITSPLRTDNLLLVRGDGAPSCLDEDPPSAMAPPEKPVRVGGNIRPPAVIKRVEPQFPDSARYAMGAGRSVLVIVESIIGKTGCVRNVRMLAQSPYGELNAAALNAISRWRFSPGLLDGQPVDVIFNLTINFKLN